MLLLLLILLFIRHSNIYIARKKYKARQYSKLHGNTIEPATHAMKITAAGVFFPVMHITPFFKLSTPGHIYLHNLQEIFSHTWIYSFGFDVLNGEAIKSYQIIGLCKVAI